MGLTGESTKFFGIPGSGKTTRLVTELGPLLDQGIYLSDICFITFSNTQAEDIKSKLREHYPNGCGFLDHSYHYIGTIHHACVQLLGWDLKNKNPGKETDIDRKEYLGRYGINYPVKNIYTSDLPEVPIDDTDIEDLTDGERLFVLMSRCNQLCIQLENWKMTDIAFNNLDPSQVYDICKGWEDYKMEKNLVSYDDMILSILRDRMTPPTRILVVDEFQDLTPLLYKVVELWGTSHKKIMVAGDDDQTIYSWGGADPRYLLDYPGEEIILEKSHRVSSDILRQAETLINKVATRKMKHMESEHAGGSFVHLIHPLNEDIIPHIPTDLKTTVFFLFRTKYLAQLFIKRFLIPYGVPFTKLRPNMSVSNVWDPRLAIIRGAMVKLDKNRPLSHWEVEYLVKILPSCSKGYVTDGFVYYGMKSKKAKNHRAEKHDTWTREDLFSDVFSKLPRWNNREILKELTVGQQNAYVTHMRSNFTELLPENVKIGTLHSAKGLEADVVFVFNNHTQKTEDELQKHGVRAWEQEARLYYVGITRARKKCVLIDDYFQKYLFQMV